jgi:hypothetical protein
LNLKQALLSVFKRIYLWKRGEGQKLEIEFGLTKIIDYLRLPVIYSGYALRGVGHVDSLRRKQDAVASQVTAQQDHHDILHTNLTSCNKYWMQYYKFNGFFIASADIEFEAGPIFVSLLIKQCCYHFKIEIS